MEKRYELNLEALKSFHRFGDLLCEAILEIESEEAEFIPDRASGDAIGKHWYGMRCHVKGRKTGNHFYLHIGLIYFDGTRTGLMAEVDEKQNPEFYSRVRKRLVPRPEFEISLEETEYLKVFMPDAVFRAMQDRDVNTQKKMLAAFVKSAGEAVVEASGEPGFFFTYEDMVDARRLGELFRETLLSFKSALCQVEINEKDPDNFGRYAFGYRYHLRDFGGLVDFYGYFGVIFSYEKEPAGIFAEIDRFSNEQIFDPLWEAFPESAWYEASKKEPGFLKLFLPGTLTEQFRRAEAKEQRELLDRFLQACNEAFIETYLRQKGKGEA